MRKMIFVYIIQMSITTLIIYTAVDKHKIETTLKLILTNQGFLITTRDS